ncbi:MAG: AarF/ABC1/UbiB kinase family protein [Deltaproteobacteria bacterium]|nr:AarF/ABC1/UbiB kinase family protein [Deltaproteobacteria bacterium]
MVSIVSAVRDLNRLREINVVLARHGFGEIVSRLSRRRSDPAALPAAEIPADEEARGEDERRRISRGERVRMVLADLGPTFVKLGQVASTRADLLPADLVVELRRLQDDVPPVPSEQIREAVESALGAPIPDVYESFDDRPLAAASIAQVHRAVLKTPEGPREVVVKVQRPGIARTIAGDVELLHVLSAIIERAIPESRIYSPTGLVAQFDRAIHAELDFTIEADNARRFAQNFAASGACRFPEVYREASSKTVLTLEYLPGRKISEALAAGHSGPKLARRAVTAIIQQIFEDGFFHADPHPGNVVVMGEPDAPELALIDLGMVGRLSPDMRDRTVDLLIAAARQDLASVADSLYAIGTPTRKVDMRAYRARVAELGEKYLGRPLGEVDLSAMIRDIVRGATEFGLEIPPDFLLVGKALMTMEGIGKELDPTLEVIEEAKPQLIEIVRRRYSPERLGTELWRAMGKVSGAARELPSQVQEILEDLRLGRLSVRTSDPDLPRVVDRLGRRILTGLVVAASVAAGAWLVPHETHSSLGIALLVMGGALLVGHLARDLRRG